MEHKERVASNMAPSRQQHTLFHIAEEGQLSGYKAPLQRGASQGLYSFIANNKMFKDTVKVIKKKRHLPAFFPLTKP